MPMTVGDALLFLSSIEQQARLARETLTQATLIGNSPDQIAMPGQPPRPRNRDVAVHLMQQHHAHKAQLAAVCNALFKPDTEHENNGIAGRIGAQLNGEPHGEAT